MDTHSEGADEKEPKPEAKPNEADSLTVNSGAPLYSPSVMGRPKPTAPTPQPSPVLPAPLAPRRRSVAVDHQPRASGLRVGAFRITDDGVYHDDSGERLSDPFLVVASASDPSGRNHVITLRTSQGQEFDIPSSLRHQPTRLVKVLEDHGVMCGLNQRIPQIGTIHKLLAQYVTAVRPSKHRIRVKTAGWHHGHNGYAFVLADGTTFGNPDILYTDPRPSGGSERDIWTIAGTLASWQREVAEFARGNSRVMLAIGLALAGALVEIAEITVNGGINQFGSSHTGKSTCAYGAASVWAKADGGMLRDWEMSEAGLEYAAAASSGTFTGFEDLRKGTSADVAERVIYVVANKGARTLATRERLIWHFLWYSTCEMDMASKLGDRATPGLLTRIADLPLPSPSSAFEDTHGQPPGDFAASLKAACLNNYGTAGRAWATKLVELRNADPDGFAAKVRGKLQEFIRRHTEASTAGQARGVIERFGLIAVAIELAIEHSILPWNAGDGVWAAETCLAAWRDHRGGSLGAAEEVLGAEVVRDFFQRYPRRFTEIGDPTIPPNHAGWVERDSSRRIVRIHFRRDLWNRGLFNSTLNPRTIAAAMVRKGMIWKAPREKHNAAKMRRTPANWTGEERPRTYHVIAAALLGDDTDE